MGNAAAVLTSFPAEGGYPTNDAYDDAAIHHLKQIETALFSDGGLKGDQLAQIIKVETPRVSVCGPENMLTVIPPHPKKLDPAVHSISYLALIEALQDYPEFSVEERGSALIEFYTSFDAMQVRYAGNWFSGWLKRLAKPSFPLPVSLGPSISGQRATDNRHIARCQSWFGHGRDFKARSHRFSPD